MEKFEGLDLLAKEVILGHTVLVIELNKYHIGKKKYPFFGQDNGPGFYWTFGVGYTQYYQGPFRKVKDAFTDAAGYLENNGRIK